MNTKRLQLLKEAAYIIKQAEMNKQAGPWSSAMKGAKNIGNAVKGMGEWFKGKKAPKVETKPTVTTAEPTQAPVKPTIPHSQYWTPEEKRYYDTADKYGRTLNNCANGPILAYDEANFFNRLLSFNEKNLRKAYNNLPENSGFRVSDIDKVLKDTYENMLNFRKDKLLGERDAILGAGERNALLREGYFPTKEAIQIRKNLIRDLDEEIDRYRTRNGTLLKGQDGKPGQILYQIDTGQPTLFDIYNQRYE